MALRPGDVVAHEFLRAPGRATSRPVDPFASALLHRFGSLLIATDLGYRFVAVAVVQNDGRRGGSVLVARTGVDEYGALTRARNRRPAARRAARRYKNRKRARA